MKVVHLPVPQNWIFFYHDKVEVVCSESLIDAQKQNSNLLRQTVTRYAIIVAVEGDQCRVKFDDYDDIDKNDVSEWISKLNLRKRIYEGDGVEVVAGNNQGRQGLVVFSFNGLLEVQSCDLVNEFFWVEANACRVTQIQDRNAVPWLGRVVTIFRGPYRPYQGVVVDVHPPRPYFTSLDVRITRLKLTVPVNHDDIYDSCCYQYLRTAVPLSPHQKHFHQATWDAEFSPNLKFAVYDCHEKRYLYAEDMVIRQPPQPWIGKKVRVVSRQWKALGTVKQVERSGKSVSGIRLQVELEVMTAVHGVPVHWFDYAEVYDPKSGYSLDVAYPLMGHQKQYWRPLISAKRIRPDKQTGSTPERRPQAQTPPWSAGPFIDPFVSTESSVGPSSVSQIISHWASDPRLVGKKFFARWVPVHGLPMDKVLVEPAENNVVKVHSGAEVFIASPQEIYDCAVGILPTTNCKPMIAIRGEQTGKYMRQIHYKYEDNGNKAIIAAIFWNWGLTNEEYVEQVDVQPDELAEVLSDWRHNPNEQCFAPQMKKLRDLAREKRPRKPKH
ncbi:hypothetical protein VKT23_020347 [Stygiomarasmius scandens]|uniref:Uncharacterized protein n=1 Tax=Marasmiellus scandens TaxID=2682957 RepID=A0ABR1IJ71_9AGAR